MHSITRSNWLSPDTLLILILSCSMVLLGLFRLDYAGDGLRHITPILESSYPVLGEPRWLLFPALLFFVIKPFALLGLIETSRQAAQLFAIFNALCGGLYLLCLRRWLYDLAPKRRAIILFLVASTFSFLSLATDTIEPMPATLIAVAGLTYSRFHLNLPPVRRLTIASATVGLASLFYQGSIFAIFFLPVTLPLTVYASRQGFIRLVTVIALVPLITVALLTIAGDSPINAARRFAQGEANPITSSMYSQRSIKNLVGVLIVGPAYALTSIPGLRGLSGSLEMLRKRATAFDAVMGLLPWLVGACAIIVTVVFLVMRQQYATLIALGGMVALPMIRMSQYAYIKFYALLPLLIVVAVAQLTPRSVYLALLGMLFFASNLSQYYVNRAESQALRSQVVHDLWPKIPREACFVTSGWGPPVPDWRGASFSWLHILTGGNSSSLGNLEAANSILLRSRFKKMFCDCKFVVTDVFIKTNVSSLTKEMQSFGIHSVSISEIVVEFPEKAKIFEAPKFSVYKFSDEERQRACNWLSNDSSSTSIRQQPPPSPRK